MDPDILYEREQTILHGHLKKTSTTNIKTDRKLTFTDFGVCLLLVSRFTVAGVSARAVLARAGVPITRIRRCALVYV